eukprot:7918805-Lingulodinium_polyedra.AAC.1
MSFFATRAVHAANAIIATRVLDAMYGTRGIHVTHVTNAIHVITVAIVARQQRLSFTSGWVRSVLSV